MLHRRKNIEAIQDTSQVVIEAMEWLKCSCGGEEIEKAFDKPVDLIPTQLALAIHSVDKADRNLEQWRSQTFKKED